jgi:hypothetical protein
MTKRVLFLTKLQLIKEIGMSGECLKLGCKLTEGTRKRRQVHVMRAEVAHKANCTQLGVICIQIELLLNKVHSFRHIYSISPNKKSIGDG